MNLFYTLLLLCCAGLSACLPLCAQSPRQYRQWAQQVRQDTNTWDSHIFLFKEYASQHPTFAHPHSQIAWLYFAKAQGGIFPDDYARIQAQADSALARGRMALQLLSPKDYKKHRSLYIAQWPALAGAAEPLELLRDSLTAQLAQMQQFRTALRDQYSHYQAATRLHEQARLRMRDLCRRYPVFLDAVSAQDTTFRSISQYFVRTQDSLRHHFAYLAAQNPRFLYTFRPVVQYRLDGLSPMTRQNGVMAAWDYGLWARQILRTAAEEAATLRQQLLRQDERLEYYLRQPEAAPSTLLDTALSSLFARYDPDALPARMQAYKAALARLLHQKQTLRLDERNYRDNFLKAHYTLFAPLQVLRDSLGAMDEPTDEQRYAEFYGKYKRNGGWANWKKSEWLRLDTVGREAERQLGRLLMREYLSTRRSGQQVAYAQWQGQRIAPVKAEAETVAEPGSFVTLHTCQVMGEGVYVAGFRQGRVREPFAALLQEGKVLWLRLLPRSEGDEQSSGQAVEVRRIGQGISVLAVHGPRERPLNQRYVLDTKGQLLHRHTLGGPQEALMLAAPDSKAQVAVWLRGTTAALVRGYSATADSLWQVELPAAAEPVDVQVSEDVVYWLWQDGQQAGLTAVAGGKIVSEHRWPQMHPVHLEAVDTRWWAVQCLEGKTDFQRLEGRILRHPVVEKWR